MLLIMNNSMVAFLILFADHIKTHLYRIGQKAFGLINILKIKEQDTSLTGKDIGLISKACTRIAAQKNGALLCIERNDDLSEYKKTGVECTSKISVELLETLFNKSSALHDGSIIVNNGLIEYAGCFFPISTTSNIAKDYGARHRAAMGLTERCDSIVILISEERGTIHLVEGGIISKAMDEQALSDQLKLLLG
jgi:diadenylate cyclase